MINGNFTSAKVDATFDCVKALEADSDGQGGQIDDYEKKIEDVKDDVAAIKVMLDEVRSLLSTPQGRREDFPRN